MTFTFDDVRRASARIHGQVVRTPVVRSDALDELAGARLLLKPENRQRTGSFKPRGAFNALLSMDPSERARGVIAVSSGNHAQAVALAAAELGASATVVMPSDANPVKVAATRALGAQVINDGVTTANRDDVVRTIASERGLVLVHPFDDHRVMAGQGTAALELAADAEPCDILCAPVGGGGLISGCAVAAKHEWPDCTVVGVEPVGAADARASLLSGERVRLDAVPDTICDGVRAMALGERTWDVIRRYVDEIVTVTDDEVLEAMRVLWRDVGERVEPSGALGVAAALHGRVRGRTIGVVVSGGNVDPAVWTRIEE